MVDLPTFGRPTMAIDSELTPMEGMRALLYGVDAVTVNINGLGTKRTLARVRNLLLNAKREIAKGILAGTEPRPEPMVGSVSRR